MRIDFSLELPNDAFTMEEAEQQADYIVDLINKLWRYDDGKCNWWQIDSDT